MNIYNSFNIEESSSFTTMNIREEEIHKMAKSEFNDFIFENRRLKIINIYSYEEAIKIITKDSKIAVISVDMTIDKDNRRLELMKYIGNIDTRIILLANKPTKLEKKNIILNYDINSYNEKKELNSMKLFNIVVTALRGYKDIKTIEENKKILKKVIEVSPELYGISKEEVFLSKVLFQIKTILDKGNNVDNECNTRGFVIIKIGKEDPIVSDTTYCCKDYMRKNIYYSLKSYELELVEKVYKKEENIFEDNRYGFYFSNYQNMKSVVYIETNSNIKVFDNELLKLFYKNINIAHENLYLYNEIEDTQREILYTLGEIAEARSKEELGNHVKRVSFYSEIIARGLNLHEEEVKTIRMAAPIHDIGKIAIPDNILLKPGKLTKDEYNKMKEHSEIGYRMLKESHRHVLKSAAIIAYEHHEKYDGTGYPRKLKGEQIHLYARIVAIADVFDALLSKRVYKDAWSLKEVIKLLKEEKGKHFDPKVVDVLLENIDEMIDIYEKYGD